MPLKAILNGSPVYARSVAGTGDFICAECGASMHYRRAYKKQDGSRVTAHFAHNPAPTDQKRSCSLSEGESEEHLNGKQTLLSFAPDHFDWLRNATGDAEVKIGDRRADVLFTLPAGQRIIFEAQFTRIPRRQIAQRTRDYHDAGYHVIWCYPEKRDDLYQWGRAYFHCVGLLSDDGTDIVQFEGQFNPVECDPSLVRAFDPEQVGYDFLPVLPSQDQWVQVQYPPPEKDSIWKHLEVIGLSFSSPKMRDAALAWERGGSLGLGHWAARHLKPLTVDKYGHLVAAVRMFLNDTTDYSTIQFTSNDEGWGYDGW